MGHQAPKLFCLLAILLATTYALPRINEDVPLAQELGTEKVTYSVLKSKFNTRENVVFAPIGYASILAMLGEGARGETRKEIQSFLQLSQDTKLVRNSFRKMMTRYGGDQPSLEPQFKSWFYVYRNNSVNEDFVRVLREDYLVEVKTIEREYYDFDVPPTSEISESVQATVTEEVRPMVVMQKDSETKQVSAVDETENTFDAVDFDGKGYLSEPGDIDQIIKQKECSRFDEEVDDKQYVEVQALRDEGATAAATQPEDNETVHPIEKLDEKKIGKIDENEETLKRMDEDEEMGALAAAKKHPVTKKFQATATVARALGGDINDVSSALSANSLTGPKESNGQEWQSKMLLFNGLYFRGKWKTPFQRLRSESAPGTVFYLQDEVEPMEVAMMRSRGSFRTTFSQSHNTQIIELPYENERYAMLIVMPVERDNGLKDLVQRLDVATIKQLSSDLKLRTVDLMLPKFNVETTSSIHKEISELGLATLFSDAADLSGITGQQQLRLDELVQHVSVRVDEGASSENSLSASDVIPRMAHKAGADAEVKEPETEKEKEQGNEEEDMFIVDRPFVFFVRDTIDDVTLVAGLINRPMGPQLFAEFVSQDRATTATREKGEGQKSDAEVSPP